MLGQLKLALGLASSDALITCGELSAATVAASTDWQQLAKAGRWQDMSVGLVGGPESQHLSGQGRVGSGFLGLRFSLPLPLRNKNEGELAEKAAAAEDSKRAANTIVLDETGVKNLRIETVKV
jgi:outer membrane protein, heavy metal efflux system